MMLKRILLVIAIFYSSILIGMYGYQDKLLYHPDTNLKEPAYYNVEMQELKLATKDGVNITAWYSPAPTKVSPVIVYFHGNAGNIGRRAGEFRAFKEEGFGVLAVSYRGFGTSEGKPSQKGLYEDARAALNFIKKEHGGLENVVLYGESLGTGIATQMASEFEVKALVLEAPYTSIADRGQELYFYIPVRWLLRDNFENFPTIMRVTEPVLVFVGEKDTIVPWYHGKKVYEAAHEPKELIVFQHNGHDMINVKEIAEKVREFLATH